VITDVVSFESYHKDFLAQKSNPNDVLIFPVLSLSPALLLG